MDWLNYTLIEAYKYKISTNVQLNINSNASKINFAYYIEYTN